MKNTEKESIIRNLFWDYNIDINHYMKMLENPEKAEPGEYRKFFVRAFENTRWHELIQLFDINTILRLHTEETKKIMKREARKRFDTACAILRGEAISTSRQDIENRKRALRPLLSDRWYSIEQRISQP